MPEYGEEKRNSQIYEFKITDARLTDERGIDLTLESDDLPGRYQYSVKPKEVRELRELRLRVNRTGELRGKCISAIIINDGNNKLRVCQVIIYTSIKRLKKLK